MNKKDIALTVGGVVATMILAYLLYRLQKRDSAAAAAAAAQAATDQEQNTNDLYSILSSAPGSYGYGYDSSSASSAPEIDTSAQLNTSGNPDEDSSAGESVLTTLLGDLTSSLSGTNEAGLIIPTLNTTATNALDAANIPTTAAQEFGGGSVSGAIGTISSSLSNPSNSGNVSSGGAEYIPPLNVTGTTSPSQSGRNNLLTNVAVS